mmetsp:Transcript_16985/g.27997  ORF Transcript_16985/g.27997 Transcript_16985/m.27997 type:complete len:196 (+) Transcript_16985:223-810(+)
MNGGHFNTPAVNSNPACQVFVGGISWKADEAALSNFFSNWGKVVSVRLIIDRETGKSKGYGFVTFQNPSDAEKVKLLGNVEFMGKMVNVSNAVRRANREGQSNFPGNYAPPSPYGYAQSSGYNMPQQGYMYGVPGQNLYQTQPQTPVGYYQSATLADPYQVQSIRPYHTPQRPPFNRPVFQKVTMIGRQVTYPIS